MIPKRSELHEIFEYETKAAEFAYENSLILPIAVCPEDGYSVKRINDFQFKCRKKSHRKIYSSLKETIFFRKKIWIKEFLHISYLWLAKVSHTAIKTLTGHSSKTITRILKIIKEKISNNMQETKVKIGGPGILVQLDESKFGKRKYNRGHRLEGAWVFAGVEKTELRRCFALIVEKRDAVTLNNIILQYVLPGSIVVTDGWKGYSLFKLNNLFVHHWVNHSITFINHEGFNTNTIEGTFNGMKLNIPPKHRNKKYLKYRLLEFIWRRQNANSLWSNLINSLRC
ncbi:hypothetical protein H312_03077 [Anncaliia algerae PRA339]|uniref:ISXO2-like transposase domain-containing protein n=1 Tax=Anncaliia algerae PRA339 TaxID=1288291 RepID=A0A059EXW5_9MICR|nr:hypothetical protein H312_03077 [Anncaliia algerae PRA339]